MLVYTDKDFYYEMLKKSVEFCRRCAWAVRWAERALCPSRSSQANIHGCVCDGRSALPGSKAGRCAGWPGYVHQRYCPTIPPFSSLKDKEQFRCGVQLILTEPRQEGVLFLPLFISYQKCYTQQYCLFVRIFSVSPLTVTKFKMGVILYISTHIMTCEIKYGVTMFPKMCFYLHLGLVVL